jgi:hypothetical protein
MWIVKTIIVIAKEDVMVDMLAAIVEEEAVTVVAKWVGSVDTPPMTHTSNAIYTADRHRHHTKRISSHPRGQQLR